MTNIGILPELSLYPLEVASGHPALLPLLTKQRGPADNTLRIYHQYAPNGWPGSRYFKYGEGSVSRGDHKALLEQTVDIHHHIYHIEQACGSHSTRLIAKIPTSTLQVQYISPPIMGSVGPTKTFSPEELPPPWKLTPADIEIDNRKDGDKGKILFKNVNIFDSTGADIYPGDVLIEGEHIKQIGKFDFTPDDDTLVIDGKGKKTLMSGLCDSHTHLSWNNAPTLDGLTKLGLEEHVLFTAQSAKTYIDCGYTMCFGAASAQPRLDIVVKGAIKSGMIPGPRTLASCQEITTTGGAIIPSISKYADGEDAMRKTAREFIELGADNIKLSMTGDYVHPTMGSTETYFTLKETKAAVEEAHNRGKRVCAHARSAASVVLCCQSGVDVVYHASFADEKGLDMLEALKDRVFVAPAINFPYNTCSGDAIPYGMTPEMAKKKGLVEEVDLACKAMKELHRRGVRVLPGGDYGFAWAPHGTYAR